MDDVLFIGMYDEYNKIVSSGNKKSYAVTVLSKKYGISERQVYYILKHFANGADIFELIHALALNKLKDKDKVFSIRKYFSV